MLIIWVGVYEFIVFGFKFQLDRNPSKYWIKGKFNEFDRNKYK